MTPQDKFHDRLKLLLDVHAERGAWFAFWPVRTESGERAWLRFVNYERKLHYDGCATLKWQTTYRLPEYPL